MSYNCTVIRHHLLISGMVINVKIYRWNMKLNNLLTNKTGWKWIQVQNIKCMNNEIIYHSLTS